MSAPRRFTWGYQGRRYRSRVLTEPCSSCGAIALVKLPRKILAQQPDGTTHMCHPLAGGCNLGFEPA